MIKIYFIIIIIMIKLIKLLLGRYCVIFYVGFFPSLLVGLLSVFRPIPALYADFPAFYVEFSHYHLPPVVPCARCANGAVGGSHGWHGGVLGLARKIMLARDLMCQPETRCRVPVRFPVLQGTVESSSADHT